jgi:hypothetical protein
MATSGVNKKVPPLIVKHSGAAPGAALVIDPIICGHMEVAFDEDRPDRSKIERQSIGWVSRLSGGGAS